MAIERFKVDPKKATKEEVERAFALLAKAKERDHKIETGQIKGTSYKPYSELSSEQKEKAQKAAAKRLIRQSLIIAKAKAAGITVTEKEVDDEIARRTKVAAA